MCSIFKYKNIVGRNFDYEQSYNEELRFINRNEFNNSFKIIGMCTGLVKDYPLFYDAMNEHGLVCGALAFEGNAKYLKEDENKYSLSSFDFILWVLGNFSNVKDVKKLIDKGNVVITDEAYSEEMLPSDLHWFIADKDDSIIIEQTKFGLNYYNGEVMTNNPIYPLQINACKDLNKDIGDISTFKWDFHTRGLQTWNLSGDYTSIGRFARLSWLKNRLEKLDGKFNTISDGFHLLSMVEQVYGVTSVNNEYEYTIYSIVYDLVDKCVYLKFYDKLNYQNEKI